jgi:tetratricopeptide (TPR) repeat protein
MVLAMSGEAHAAIADAEKALRLSPLDHANYLPHMGMVVAHITLNQFEDAANRAMKVIEINPGYPMSYAWLMVAECGRGNREEAQRLLGRLAEILPDFGPEKLAVLFEIFPPDLRRRSIAILHASGFVPPLEQEG